MRDERRLGAAFRSEHHDDRATAEALARQPRTRATDRQQDIIARIDRRLVLLRTQIPQYRASGDQAEQHEADAQPPLRERVEGERAIEYEHDDHEEQQDRSGDDPPR